MSWLLLAACAGGEPLVVAHQGGADWWPADSEVALRGAVEQGWEAVHIDLFLSSDRVPMLAPWASLDPDTCTTVDGAPLGEEPVWIYAYTAAELQAGWLCGALPDPAHPDALVEPAPLLTQAQALALLPDELPAYAELRWWKNVSHSPEVTAAEVLERWWASGHAGPAWVLSDAPQVIQAAEERAGDADLPTALRWPRVPPLASPGWAAVGDDLGAAVGLADPVAAAQDADGIVFSGLLVERGQLAAARDAGLTVSIESSAPAFLRWPVDCVLTDAPEPAP